MRTVDENRRAWDIANRKYVEESDAFLDAADRGTLLALETRLLAPLTQASSVVLHVQSGNGTDDVALSRLSGSTVIGVDFSEIAAAAAQARANRLRIPVTYAVGDALRLPVASGQVDLVYTGEGAVVWLPDLHAWAGEIARVLRGGGHVFLYEAHPAGALWTLDETSTSVRNDRNYFGGTTSRSGDPATRSRCMRGREACRTHSRCSPRSRAEKRSANHRHITAGLACPR